MAYTPMPIYSYGLYSYGLGSEAAFGARTSLPTPVHLPVHMPVHMYVQVSIHMSIYVYMGINVRARARVYVCPHGSGKFLKLRLMTRK